MKRDVKVYSLRVERHIFLPLILKWVRSAQLIVIALGVILAALEPSASAQGLSRVITLSQDEAHATAMSVPINKSQVLQVDRPFSDLAVGNPATADVVALSDRTLFILGKVIGSTNLSIYDQNHRVIAIVDILVTQDIAGLKAKLSELLPSNEIEVRSANSSVVLSGTVSNSAIAGQAVAIAENYAPDKVMNLLQVKGSQQVMLSVKVAEMSRTVARDLGIKAQDITLGKGTSNFTYSTLDPVFTNAFGSAVANWTTGFLSLNLLMDALDQKGVIKILAEPNLVALSGDTADFLAGGEFPVPEVQSGTGGAPTISVAFKKFGVSLSFTPTVIDGKLINLVVSPEVSQVDTTNSVTISGFSIPGISTRRATTTVELRDGQSFAIAGLLQSNLQDQVRQLPGLGNLPVIGALFRDSQTSQTDSELVIIVTPTLVKPAPAGSLAAPTDTFVPPSTSDLFFNGNVEDATSGKPATAAKQALGTTYTGGLSGSYGYIIK